MENNEIINLLNRHKKDIICDICRKRVWFFQKGIRCVVRTKENVWAEYYHIKCLENKGVLRRLRKIQAGRRDNKDGDNQSTSNVVH